VRRALAEVVALLVGKQRTGPVDNTDLSASRCAVHVSSHVGEGEWRTVDSLGHIILKTLCSRDIANTGCEPSPLVTSGFVRYKTVTYFIYQLAVGFQQQRFTTTWRYSIAWILFPTS